MKTDRQSAFTLIELIFVLGIVAILTAVLAISFVKHLDQVATQKEDAALMKIAEAFRQSALRNRAIPGAATWHTTIATQLGLPVDKVRYTDRKQARVFLIHPDLKIGQSGGPGFPIPYSQPVTGSRVTSGSGTNLTVVAPSNLRFMIVSTISTPLPSGLVSGVTPTNGPYSFMNLWNTPHNWVPASWSFGKGEDLRIQRVDLSGLFIQITLNDRDNAKTPSFAIDNYAATNLANGPFTTYFLRGTELRLYNEAGTNEYTEVVYNSMSYSFELGSWQGDAYLGLGVGQPGPLDLQRAMNLFLKSKQNPHAGNYTLMDKSKTTATPERAYQELLGYLKSYVAWANDGYPFAGANPVSDVTGWQSSMAGSQGATTQLIIP